MSEAIEQDRIRQAVSEPSVLGAVDEELTSLTHAHVHEHADGTVHSHYHTHPSGDVVHEHASTGRDKVALDQGNGAHTLSAIPEHSHAATISIKPPLVARELVYAYPHQKQSVFSGLSFHANPASMLAILGNNGAGKSTLLDLLAGITKPTAGSVLIDGEDASALSRKEIAQRIAYVAQQQTVPHLSVYDEVLLGRKPHISWSVRQIDREVVSRALIDLELEQFAERFCDELSGGERQKVFIARALAQEPHILILDEPTSALDPKNQLEVLEVVRRVTHETGLASVLVLHDVNLALRFCDRFMLVRDGEVVAVGDRSVVTSEVLTQTYGAPFKIVEVDGVPVAVPA